MEVSIIVPVYNRRAYLRDALKSALAERQPGLEILVVDDGSTDDSLATIRDLPVKVVSYGGGKRGPAAARNRGLALAKGQMIGFLDSDDLVVPNGLRWRVQFLLQNKDIGAVAGTLAGIVDAAGMTVGSYEYVFPGHQSQADVPGTISVTLFRREYLAQLGKFDERLNVADDKDLFLRAVRGGRLARRPFPVILYRLHGENLSVLKEGSKYRARPVTRAEGWLLSQET